MRSRYSSALRTIFYTIRICKSIRLSIAFTLHVLCELSIVASFTANATASLVSTETGFLPCPSATDNKPAASNFVHFANPCFVVGPQSILLRCDTFAKHSAHCYRILNNT
ncbi:hypothetical protein AVEN_154348-1 [Araneus ventricosus]|uniref:Uncharacterized protein n=1 Tax=Araneus ventricosus TaxID=182803 RepID=A0A4Y2M5W6_ARAVE|nr:hypothetical protein AVEN_154348-1 [Araneus ventricosus]